MVKSLMTARIRKYDEQKKKQLGDLAKSDKSWSQILAFLDGEIKQSTQMTNVRYKILCFKNDGVYQLNKAIEEIYGVSQSNDKGGTPSGDSEGVQTVDVQLADGTRLKVPYGKIEMPEAGSGAFINIEYDPSSNMLHVTGKCEFRFTSMIDDIIERTKELLITNSIYKNQAIELGSGCVPTILNLSSIDKEFMILSDSTEYALTPLRSRILHPDKCVAKGISLKFGALMSGPYGTGKTLLAFKLAKEAIENGWVFMYLKDPTLLAQTLRLAKTLDKNGHGVVIFVEDVDQVTRGDRDSAMQDILNTLDGGDTKQMNVISLFTTNHIELIEPTFLRGKRIGSIISLDFLDAKTARKFIEFTFSKDGYSLETEGLDEVCKFIESSNIAPAFMAEITESVKSNMILTDDTFVKVSYIKNSVKSYLDQVRLSRVKDTSKSDSEKLAEALKNTIIGELSEKIQEIKDYIED